MKIVIARAQVRPDSRETFIRAAQACVAATRQEMGCLAYDIFESLTESGAFVSVEQWEDEAAIDAHFLLPHTAAFLKAAAECVNAPPLIEEFETNERRVR
jgi:quinol monooxygenase YgiN